MNNKEQKGTYFCRAVMVSLLVLKLSSFAYDVHAAPSPVHAKPTEAEASTEMQTSAATQETNADGADSVADDHGFDDELAVNNHDPLEPLNRAVFTFNDTLDVYFFKPIAKFYNAVVPKPLNKGIHNFFNNLSQFPIIANDLLQLNFYQSAKDVSRFAINSTMGIGGFFDIATCMNLPYFDNDFGLTLAVWGYRNSTYLVIPFLGSSTIRDGIGIPVDYFGFSIYPHVQPQSTRFVLLALYFVDHRANLLQIEPILEEVAIDKYVFMRNAYMQHRAYQIEQLKHLGFKNRDEISGLELNSAQGQPETN